MKGVNGYYECRTGLVNVRERHLDLERVGGWKGAGVEWLVGWEER